MALNFPTSPTLNQLHTVGSKTWKWNGYAWDLQVQVSGTVDSASVTAAWNTANNSYAQANTATTLAQAAYDAANNANGSIDVSIIDTSNNLSNTLNSITALRFSEDSGFNLTDLGSGAVKVSVNLATQIPQLDIDFGSFVSATQNLYLDLGTI